MSDIIWALDQRERCIACPSKPVANAVVLHLGADGALARDAVEQWARDGVMAASVAWPGAAAGLDDDDWLDLEDAASGLGGLASAVAVVGEGDTEGSAGASDVSSFEALHPARTSPTPPVKSVRRRRDGMGEGGFGVMICTPI